MNINDFYLKFEEKHRGDCAVVKKRLGAYIPFLEKIKSSIVNPKAIDLGCGRGEWLELLEEHSFSAIGIDLDEGMLSVAKQKGLNVILGDAIDALKNEEDSSLALVSGFHIAEHLSFDELLLLVQEALRVLKSGGLLILETPNPENIRVATTGFYLDPTHVRPIPSELLLFLVQQSGFFRTIPIYLQETKHLKNEINIQLLEVLGGVSPDYAVIGQKNADTAFLHPFDTLFEAAYGINLETLANKFEARMANTQYQTNIAQKQIEATNLHVNQKDQEMQQYVNQKDQEMQQLKAYIEAINLHVNQKDQEMQQLKAYIEAINLHVNQKDQEMQQLKANIEAINLHVNQKDQEMQQLTIHVEAINQLVNQNDKEINIFRNELINMHSSLSWKITHPLRVLNRWRKWFFLGVYSWITFSHGSRPRRIVKNLLPFLKAWIMKHPSIYKIIFKFYISSPWFKATIAKIENEQRHSVVFEEKQDSLNHLSPQTKHVLKRLKHVVKSIKMDK